MQDNNYMNKAKVGFNYIQATIINDAVQHFIQAKQSHIEKAEREPRANVIEGLFDYVNACNIHSQLQKQFNGLKRCSNFREFQRKIKSITLLLNDAEFDLLKNLLNETKVRTNGKNKTANIQFTSTAA